RHHILVIGAVAGVVVQENFRPPGIQYLLKSKGVAAVALDKIAVQVQVARIPPETVGTGAILVDTALSPVKAAIDIINRDDADHHVLRQRIFLEQVAGEHHAGIYTLRLTWMNAIIDQQYPFALLFNQRRAKNLIA